MVIPSLPPEIEAALAEIVRSGAGDGDYATLIRRAVFALRDELLALTPCVQTTVYLGADIHVVAAMPPGEAPRVMFAGRRVEVDLVWAGRTPSAAEVDAMERIFEAVGDARDLFRAAYRQANP